MAKRAQGITAITVGGYKSIRDETTIKIRPLTILAGANSSGKSSIMQPMLMVKQTLDAVYDAGALLLNGPNIRFTQYEQLLPVHSESSDTLTAGCEVEDESTFSCTFRFRMSQEGQKRHIKIVSMDVVTEDENFTLSPDMTEEEIIEQGPKGVREFLQHWSKDESKMELGFKVNSSRCFLQVEVYDKEHDINFSRLLSLPFLLFFPDFRPEIKNLIHLPGLRGNPERVYPIAAAQGPNFPGTFENYVASMILRWQQEGNDVVLAVANDLKNLGLTKWVKANPVDDSSVELRVGRIPVQHEEPSDLDGVSIADVGIGVSQVLPVLVALRAAEPGQLVYIEQPELHLHPRAQVALASVLADAAKRGVRVVIETHSSLLLQAVMTLIAQDELDHEDVILHWFSRDEEGYTKVDSVEPDENGAYGDWPEDFGDVELEIMGKYLNAVGERDAVPDNE